jgi:hypothetical protein
VFKPNFNSISRSGDHLVVSGNTPAQLVEDALEVRVILTQGETVAPPASAPSIGEGWQVEVAADGFEPGACVAFGIETHGENATTITWAQALDIPKA